MRRPFGDKPERYFSSYENVRFLARDGVTLAGWFVPQGDTKRAAVLLHGHGSSRTQVLARARLLHDHGYAVLLYDARGHGESAGDLVSIGWYEKADLLGAIDWLRARGLSEIGCLGISQGGATVALAAGDLPGIRWAILESVFPTLQNAVDRRFRRTLGLPGWFAGAAMIPIAEWRLGVKATAVSPRDAIGALACPILVMTGGADTHTNPADAREVFDYAREPKTWIVIPGAAHVDLYGYAKQRYEQIILEFLASCE